MLSKIVNALSISSLMMLMMGNAYAADLSMTDVKWNDYLTLQGDGIYYFLDGEENSYQNISYVKQEGPGLTSDNQFLYTSNVQKNITVLCDKLYLENRQ